MFKFSNNTIVIHHRLASFNYILDIDNICTYIFDINKKCDYVSGMHAFIGKKSLKQLFPHDVVDFMDNLIVQSFGNPQMVHVVINNVHVLFSTHAFYNHNNDVIGVVVHQIPYTTVQALVPSEMETSIPLGGPMYCLAIEQGVKAVESTKMEKVLGATTGASMDIFEHLIGQNIFDMFHYKLLHDIRSLFVENAN